MSPVVVEAEVDINRPPEEVFDYCSDHRHEPQWNPMMTRIEKLTGGPVGAGTRYAAEFVKGPPMVMECTRYERPSTWSLTGKSRALTAAGGWRVLPTADGARLVMRVEMELHGLLKLAAPLVRRREQPMFQRDLDNIKARLEAAHAAPGTGPGQQESEMQTMKQAAAEFLAGKRVAVTGVSRNPQGHGSNVVYQRLRQRGYEVFAVNPNADQVEGDPCYHDLTSVPGGVDWVLIGTRPQAAEAIMRECADLGIRRVWMHRGPGAGSVSHPAADYGRQHGITVIEGGCPCMFGPTADPGHKAMRFIFTLTGNVPRRVQ